MSDKKTIPVSVSAYLARIGSAGGKKGSKKNKRKAGLLRWGKVIEANALDKQG